MRKSTNSIMFWFRVTRLERSFAFDGELVCGLLTAQLGFRIFPRLVYRAEGPRLGYVAVTCIFLHVVYY